MRVALLRHAVVRPGRSSSLRAGQPWRGTVAPGAVGSMDEDQPGRMDESGIAERMRLSHLLILLAMTEPGVHHVGHPV